MAASPWTSRQRTARLPRASQSWCAHERSASHPHAHRSAILMYIMLADVRAVRVLRPVTFGLVGRSQRKSGGREQVEPSVNEELRSQLEAMGFGHDRAVRAVRDGPCEEDMLCVCVCVSIMCCGPAVMVSRPSCSWRTP